MYIVDLVCCTAEINTTLWSNYTPLKIKLIPTIEKDGHYYDLKSTYLKLINYLYMLMCIISELPK